MTFFGPELPPEMKRAREEANKAYPIHSDVVHSQVDPSGQVWELTREVIPLEEFKNSEEGKDYIWESDEESNGNRAIHHRHENVPERLDRLVKLWELADSLGNNREASAILAMQPLNCDDDLLEYLNRLTKLEDSLRISRNNIEASRLLRLPREIRDQIYSYVLEVADPIQVRVPFRRSRCSPSDGDQDHKGRGKARNNAEVEDLPAPTGDELHEQDDGNDWEEEDELGSPEPHPSGRRIPLEVLDAMDAHVKSSLTLALFTTCRRISAESLSHFYSHNTFSIPGILFPSPLIATLPTLIGEHNFDCICKLEYHVHLYEQRISGSSRSSRSFMLHWKKILGRASNSMAVLRRWLPKRLGVDMVLILASEVVYKRFTDAGLLQLRHAIREGYPAVEVEWRVSYAEELRRPWALTEEPLTMMVYISERGA